MKCFINSVVKRNEFILSTANTYKIKGEENHMSEVTLGTPVSVTKWSFLNLAFIISMVVEVAMVVGVVMFVVFVVRRLKRIDKLKKTTREILEILKSNQQAK